MVEPRLTLVRAYRTCVDVDPIRPIVGGCVIVSGNSASQSGLGGRRGSPKGVCVLEGCVGRWAEWGKWRGLDLAWPRLHPIQ